MRINLSNFLIKLLSLEILFKGLLKLAFKGAYIFSPYVRKTVREALLKGAILLLIINLTNIILIFSFLALAHYLNEVFCSNYYGFLMVASSSVGLLLIAVLVFFNYGRL